MQRLKLEEHIFLTDTIIKVLSLNRITTILDFLQEDTEKLVTLTKLSLPQVLSIRNDILKKYSAPLLNGTAMLTESLMNKTFRSTGIQSLDAVLGGGISIGYITEVCGLADSGKSQLCLQLAINSVKYSENTVLYIDTKGDFSAIRIQKILDACGHSHKEMALIMFKIRIVHIWTMDELIELFKQLKNKTLVVENLSLIVIDSLPCLMFQYLGDENKVGLSFLNMFVNYSRYLCKEFRIGIICVNIQTRWVDKDVADLEGDDDGEQSTSLFKESYYENRNRCLGKYWQEIPAYIILLEKIQGYANEKSNCSQVNVTVVKSSTLSKRDQKCVLKISNLGVT